MRDLLSFKKEKLPGTKKKKKKKKKKKSAMILIFFSTRNRDNAAFKWKKDFFDTVDPL
jgi:hypothetical protein